MTTNVYDFNNKIMATDSRWSSIVYKGLSPYALIYVDDTSFEKIHITDQSILMFAGDLCEIAAWKEWITDTNLPMPSYNKIAVCSVDRQSGVVSHKFNQDYILNNATFTGTGSPHALSHWKSYNDSIGSVSHAMGLDIYSGGEIKFYNFNSHNHNIYYNNVDANIVISEILQRGKIMKHNTVINVKDCQDPIIIDHLQKLSTGQAVIEAPYIGVNKILTDEDKNDFERFMLKTFRS